MIVFAQSSDFVKLFPTNVASEFRLRLLQRQEYAPDAQIALLEIIIPPVAKPTLCYIYCSLVGYSQFGEKWQRVLRVIDLQANISEKFSFPSPFYFDLFCDNIEEIHFTLKDESDKLIEFASDGKTVIVFDIKNGTF